MALDESAFFQDNNTSNNDPGFFSILQQLGQVAQTGISTYAQYQAARNINNPNSPIWNRYNATDVTQNGNNGSFQGTTNQPTTGTPVVVQTNNTNTYLIVGAIALAVVLLVARK